MAITLSNYTKSCELANGGIDAVYVYEVCQRASYTLASGVITALTMNIGYKAYTLTPDMESAMFSEASTGNRANNSVMNVQTGMIQFKDDLNATVTLATNISKAKLGVIVKKSDADGSAVYRHYGLLNGMTITTIDSVLGQLYEDLRGHTVNWTGKELGKAPSISEAIVTSLLVPAS
jgi:hypothetical protein